MNSSQSQQQSTSISIQTIEFSIENLIKSWIRRQKWKVQFNSPQQLEDYKKSPWRTHLANFLESTPIHVIALSLLLADLILTTLELSSSLLSCAPSKHEKGQVWYHWLGITILSLLGLRTVGLAIGLGGSCFRRPGCVIDGVVVMAALVLEVFLERKGGGLVVVVSLWRVVRVVESAFELSDEAIEGQIEVIVCQFEALREENRRLLGIIADKDGIIEELQEELEKCEHA
ncbi:hypothetical protein LOK49_LG08G01992 [Camellia lanceoleosa]|uniref:Uncharacterized protein n=1 Tax=Camellia lanceoleosa TaxID=1840588 RepID=A0ACC0GQK0_9ERIC|nr:hypothetical protein LOK49_LG08G01992 [Camellia lanceoleosa]